MLSLANETTFFLDVEGLATTSLQVLAFDGIEGLKTENVFEIFLINHPLRLDIAQLLSNPVYISFLSIIYSNPILYGELEDGQKVLIRYYDKRYIKGMLEVLKESDNSSKKLTYI